MDIVNFVNYSKYCFWWNYFQNLNPTTHEVDQSWFNIKPELLLLCFKSNHREQCICILFRCLPLYYEVYLYAFVTYQVKICCCTSTVSLFLWSCGRESQVLKVVNCPLHMTYTMYIYKKLHHISLSYTDTNIHTL